MCCRSVCILLRKSWHPHIHFIWLHGHQFAHWQAHFHTILIGLYENDGTRALFKWEAAYSCHRFLSTDLPVLRVCLHDLLHFVAFVNIRCLHVAYDGVEELRHLMLRLRHIGHHVHDATVVIKYILYVHVRIPSSQQISVVSIYPAVLRVTLHHDDHSVSEGIDAVLIVLVGQVAFRQQL